MSGYLKRNCGNVHKDAVVVGCGSGRTLSWSVNGSRISSGSFKGCYHCCCLYWWLEMAIVMVTLVSCWCPYTQAIEMTVFPKSSKLNDRATVTCSHYDDSATYISHLVISHKTSQEKTFVHIAKITNQGSRWSVGSGHLKKRASLSGNWGGFVGRAKLVLKIWTVRCSDRGIYKCTVILSNKDSFIKPVFGTFNVTALPESVRITPYKLSVKSGQLFNLTCIGYLGNPPAKMIWGSESKALVPDHGTRAEHHKAVFYNVERVFLEDRCQWRSSSVQSTRVVNLEGNTTITCSINSPHTIKTAKVVLSFFTDVTYNDAGGDNGQPNTDIVFGEHRARGNGNSAISIYQSTFLQIFSILTAIGLVHFRNYKTLGT